MEFIEGRNLREFVRIRKKLEPLEATQMMIGITDGLVRLSVGIEAVEDLIQDLDQALE